MTFEQKLMLNVINRYDEWIDYYSCVIKKEWIEQRLPYDRMAMSIEEIYLHYCERYDLNPQKEILNQL